MGVLERRQVLAGCAASCLTSSATWAAREIRVKTFTYKRVNGLPIKLDVHRADDARRRPVVVWIHGGALIMGSRSGVDSRVKKGVLDAGCALVSIDYRLAPETKLPAIIEDLQDALAWVHAEGPDRFNGDTTKVVVMGGSAGGYLTLTAGFRAKPRPAALVSFWGYGDLVGAWYSQPSPHRRHHTDSSFAAALKQVEGPPVSAAEDRNGDGGLFYRYCRQHGIWPQQVSTWDPHKMPEKFYPYMPLKNLTADYPPTLLIHGTADTDVPYQQSVLMAEGLRKQQVEHQLISIAGGEHGLGGGDPDRVDAAYMAAMTFVQRYLGS